MASRLPKLMKNKGRLEAFSDGVFAIAITLLVIEIAVPLHAGGHLLSALFDERPVYVAYFIAFMSIGMVWIEHSSLTEALDHIDSGFQRLNLLLLLLVAFLPYPTRVMEEYLSLVDSEHGGERTAVAFFGIVLFLMSLMLIVLGRYAEREGLFGADVAEERAEESRLKYQLAPSLVLYGFATVCGLIEPYAGVVLYVLIGIYLLLPTRTVTKLLRRKG
jgi:TMEM175 potassium channel family protein